MAQLLLKVIAFCIGLSQRGNKVPLLISITRSYRLGPSGLVTSITAHGWYTTRDCCLVCIGEPLEITPAQELHLPNSSRRLWRHSERGLAIALGVLSPAIRESASLMVSVALFVAICSERVDFAVVWHSLYLLSIVFRARKIRSERKGDSMVSCGAMA